MFAGESAAGPGLRPHYIAMIAGQSPAPPQVNNPIAPTPNSPPNDEEYRINQVLRGWLAYFTAFYSTAVSPLCQRIDRHLVRWARKKYRRLERSDKRARGWLEGVRSRAPELFVHWKYCSPL